MQNLNNFNRYPSGTPTRGHNGPPNDPHIINTTSQQMSSPQQQQHMGHFMNGSVPFQHLYKIGHNASPRYFTNYNQPMPMLTQDHGMSNHLRANIHPNGPSSSQMADVIDPSHMSRNLTLPDRSASAPSLHSMGNRNFVLNPNAQPFQPSYSNMLQFAGRNPSFRPPYMSGYEPTTVGAIGNYMEQPADLVGNVVTVGTNISPTATVDEYYPCNGGEIQSFSLSPSLEKRIKSDSNCILLVQIQVGLEALLRAEPSDINTWATAILTRLSDAKMESNSRDIVAQVIIEMTVIAKNSQFIFGKLCAILFDAMPEFLHDHLLTALEEYYKKTWKILTIENKSNLLMFYAELYDKVMLDSGSHVRALGKAVCEIILEITHVDQICDDLIRPMLSSLKIVGPHLDDDKDLRGLSDEIFTRLDAHSKYNPVLEMNVKEEIKQLFSLRYNLWDERNLRGKVYKNDICISDRNDKVMGPDGEWLSEEERDFLVKNLQSSDGLEADAGNSDIDGKEDTMEDAMEEFCNSYEDDELQGLEEKIEKLETGMELLDIKESNKISEESGDHSK